jgi:hypothetical protein
MKVEKKDNSAERLILTGMIVDRDVIGRIAPRWQSDMFQSKWSNIIGGWCIHYFNRYGKAPKKNIERLFHTWASTNQDKNTIKLIERYLEQLSGEYERRAKDSNSQYILDQAGEYFNKVKLLKLAETIQSEIDLGRLDKAAKARESFGQIELGSGQGVNVLQDDAAWEQSFQSKSESLVEYPHALKNFFGDALERDGFIAFMGEEKRGKTWWLLDIAWRAMMQHKKVAFFEVGDLSQNQIMRRFGIRAAGRPLKPGIIKIPRLMEPEGDECSVDFEEREFRKPLSEKSLRLARSAIMTEKLKTKRPLLKLFTYPNCSISAAGIESVIQSLESQEWIPDLIVIDYADILAPMAGYEGRDAINANWMKMRAISQTYHCLLVTATQANAKSYETRTLTKANFSEDHRKFAHVTGMIGLSQSDTEKIKQIIRLNWLVLREGEFVATKCVHVAGCLGIANPAIRSIFIEGGE